MVHRPTTMQPRGATREQKLEKRPAVVKEKTRTVQTLSGPKEITYIVRKNRDEAVK